MATGSSESASRARIVRALTLGAGLVLLAAAALYGPALVARLGLTAPTPLQLEKVRRARLLFAAGGAGLVAFSFAVARARTLRAQAGRPGVALALLVGLGLLLPLSLLELGARPFVSPKTSIFEPDAKLGWRLVPNAQDEWGGVRVAVNAQGHRGSEVPLARAPGARRILFLGDSVTFGFGVARDEELFPARTARALADRLGPVEVVNTGVGGYSPWQQLLVWRRDGPRFSPDLVVVGFVWNDVTEKLALVRYGGENRGWQLDRSSASAVERGLSRSGLVFLVREGVARARFGWDVAGGAANAEEQAVRRLVADPEDRRLRRGWVTAFESLSRLADEVAGRGARLVLVVFPFAFQLDAPDASAGPQRKLLAWARAEGVTTLDLMPALLDRARTGQRAAGDYFLDASHLSPEGHRVVAEVLADFIEERALLVASGR